MLVLRLKEGETVVIGGQIIKIKVVEIDGRQVAIGFEAPREIKIMREELMQPRPDFGRTVPKQAVNGNR